MTTQTQLQHSNSKKSDADDEEEQSKGEKKEQDAGGEEDAPTITKWEAIFMVINIYVGSTLVILPASFAYAGYAAAIIIFLMAGFSGLCAYQLVDGMQRAGESYYLPFRPCLFATEGLDDTLPASTPNLLSPSLHEQEHQIFSSTPKKHPVGLACIPRLQYTQRLI